MQTIEISFQRDPIVRCKTLYVDEAGLLNIRHKRSVCMTLTLGSESPAPEKVHVWLLRPFDPMGVVVNTDPESETKDIFVNLDYPVAMQTHVRGVGPRKGHFTGVIKWPQNARAITVKMRFMTRSIYGRGGSKMTGGVEVHAAFSDSPTSNGSKPMKVVSEFRRSQAKANLTAKGLEQGWSSAKAFKEDNLQACKEKAHKMPVNEIQSLGSALQLERDHINHRLNVLRDELLTRAGSSSLGASGAEGSQNVPLSTDPLDLGSIEDSDWDDT